MCVSVLSHENRHRIKTYKYKRVHADTQNVLIYKSYIKKGCDRCIIVLADGQKILLHIFCPYRLTVLPNLTFTLVRARFAYTLVTW